MTEPALKKQNVEKIGPAIENALRQVLSLDELVDELLDVAKIRTGRFTLSRSSVDLKELVEEAVSRFSAQLANRKVRLELQEGILVGPCRESGPSRSGHGESDRECAQVCSKER